MVVCCAKFSFVGSARHFKPARMTFHLEGHFTFYVMRHVLFQGQWKGCLSPYVAITSRLDSLLAHSGYLLCPGISDHNENHASVIRFVPKSLRVCLIGGIQLVVIMHTPVSFGISLIILMFLINHLSIIPVLLVKLFTMS